MNTVTRHSDTCQIKQVSSGRQTVAEVQDFREQQQLNVVVNKSVKLSMKWNGKVYEGRMAGMDFESLGPTISKTQLSSRG